MKNIGVLGNYTKTSKLLTCLKTNDEKLNIFRISPSTSHILLFADVIILNKYQDNFNLKNISPNTAIIINSDSFCKTNPTLLTATSLITTGYSPKSTLTISSITLNDINTILCCLQRSIKSCNGYELTEQEFTVQTKFDDTSLLLSAIATALYLGMDKNKIKNIFK